MRRKGPRRLASPLLILLASCITAGAQGPASSEPPGSQPARKAPGEAASRAVDRFVEALRKHPTPPSTVANRVGGLFLLDLSTGRTMLVADEPDPGIGYCGSPAWLADGSGILFDAFRPEETGQAHIKRMSIADGRPTTTDLGNGNCPSPSPDGRRIAFLNNIGPPTGVWMMQADGSGRKSLGEYGRPQWSPGGHQMMITSFSNPCDVTIMDADPEKSGPLQVPDNRIYSVPRWVAERTILAVIGEGDTIASIDTTTPAKGRVKDILWKKGQGLNLSPEYPTLSPTTGECIFVGQGPEGKALYAFKPGQKEPPRRLEAAGHDKLIQDPILSPDGRYLLFTSDRPAPQAEAAPAASPRPR